MRFLLLKNIYLICLISCSALSAFDTITELVHLSQQLPELPENEYVHPYRPSYKKLHKSIASFTSFSDLKNRLQRVVQNRELQGFYGDFVQKFYIDIETKWYVWGPLHGAFHSLVRALVELKEQGVIDEKLKIIKERFRFVFNGNVLNYAPYQLETLSLIVSLLEKNPNQIFWVKGDFEQKNAWRKTVFKDELLERLPNDYIHEIPLERELDSLFNTLPLALYLLSTELDVLRISFYKKHPLLTEQEWGFFFSQQRSQNKKIKNIIKSDQKSQTKASITGHSVEEVPYAIRDLSYKKDNGTHDWEMFSSPLRMFKMMFNFYEDALIVLTTGKFFSNWKVELYRQQLKDAKGFVRARMFNVMTGKEEFTTNQNELIGNLEQKIQIAQIERKKLEKECSVVEQQKKEEQREGSAESVEVAASKKTEEQAKEMALQGNTLVVGTLQDLSKSVKDIAAPFRDALLLVLDDFNDQGGAHGLKIRMVSQDDQYNPEKTRAFVEQFLDVYKTDIILGAQGTPTLASYLDLIREKKILSIFPFTGAFHDVVLPYFIRLRASYVDVGDAVTTFMIKNKGAKKFAFFYQDDQFGKDNLNGGLKALKKAGIEDYLAVPYDPHKPNLEKQVNDIRQFNPDALGLFSVPFSSEKLLNRFDIKWLLNVMLFANEYHGIEKFKTFIQKKGKTITSAHAWPNPKTSDMPIVKEYRARMERAGFPLNDSTLEGYITASVFLDIFKKMQMPFTKERFIDQVRSIKDYDFQGLKLNFDPKTGQLFNTIWIDPGEGPWIKREISDAKVVLPKKEKIEKKEISEQDEADVQTTDEQQDIDEKPEMALQNNVLILGNTSDFSRTLKGFSKNLKQGLLVPIKEVNQESGVNGIRLVVNFLDDAYDGKLARENVYKLLNDFKTDILLGAMGTPTLQGYLDLVKDKKVLSVFPNTSSFRDADLSYLVHLRASNYDMGYAVTSYALKNTTSSRFAFLYQDDPFGKEILRGAQAALKEAGITEYIALPHERHEANFGPQAQEIKEFDPDGIGFFTNPLPAELLIKQLGAEFLLGKILIGSEVINLLREYAKQRGIQFVLPSVVPNPHESDLAFVREYRRMMENNNLPINIATLEGYMNGIVFVELLRQMDGPFTKENFLKTVKSIKDYDFKGLKLNFNPNTRQLMNTLWLNTGDKEWARKDLNGVEPVKAQDAEDDQTLSAVEASLDDSSSEDTSSEIALQDGVLVVGNTSDFSKTLKEWSEFLKNGLMVPIDNVNKEGINGMRFRVVTLDDGYDGSKARANIMTLLNDFKTDIVLATMGTPTLTGYIDLVKDKKVLSIFPHTSSYHTDTYPYLLHWRASNFDMGYAVTDYIIKNKDIKRFAFVYQDDLFGRELFDGVSKALEQSDITDFIAIAHERHETSFNKHVQKIKDFDPDAIGFMTNDFPTKLITKALGASYLFGKTIFGDLVLSNLEDYFKEIGVTAIYPSVVPNPKNSDLEIVKEYREQMTKNNLPVNLATLEGYINGAVFLEIISKIDGPFSKQAFLDVYEGFKDYDFKGLIFNFDAKKRQLMQTIWINTGDGDWIRKDVSSIESDTSKDSEASSSSDQSASPQAKDMAMHGDVLVVGNITDFSKTFKGFSQLIKEGMEGPIKKINAGGGIDGVKVQMVYLDDAYDPVIARKRVDELFNISKTDILLSAHGTSTLASYIDFIKQHKLLSIFPITGSFRESGLKNLIFLRASFADEGRALANYLLKQNGSLKKVAFFYQDDNFGKSLMRGALDVLQDKDGIEFIKVPYQRNVSQLTNQVKAIVDFKPDALALFGSDVVAQNLIKELGTDVLIDTTLFANRSMARKNFKDFIANKGLSLVVTQVTPNPQTSDLPIVKDFRSYAQEAQVPLDSIALEGYINAALFLDIVQKMDKPFTKQGFIQAAERIKDYDFKGLKLHFNPKTRQLLHSIWIDSGEKDWERISID